MRDGPSLASSLVPELPVDIARARRADLPAVQDLAGRIWRAHYPGIITAGQIEYMLERGSSTDALAEFVDAPRRGLEIARVNGEMAGFAAWYVMDTQETAKLDKLYVLQVRQRAGIGRRLIMRVAAHAREFGARTLVLNVNRSNAQAIAAYRKHGFVIREAVVVDIGQGYVMDDYVMARAI